MKEAPAKIYLQWTGDDDSATWCVDRIEQDDVEYIRADLGESGAVERWNTGPGEDALRAENERLRAEQAAMRQELIELWNGCDNLPHAVGCEAGDLGYCNCERGKFNSFLYNVCVNYDALKGGEW
jgi:hypothetical protein